MIEEWRPVVGYEGLYEVSNLGRVKSLPKYRCKEERILSQGTNWKGYKFLPLYKDKKSRSEMVHRLVATAFIPNPNNYPIVNHKDCNPANNIFTNLEWCSYSYNNTYGDRIQKCAIKKYKKIGRYSKDGELLEVYSSMQEAEKAGFRKNLSECCHGKRPFAYGFIWRFIE